MRACVAVMLAIVAVGCGDDGEGGGGNGPALIAGGGASGSAISGKLHVFVIDEPSGAPLAGAAVRVGASANGAGQLTGSTDASGLITFTDASLTGKQAVTVTAGGHVPVTWVGIDATNITIPMGSTAARPAPDSATIMASISGWDALPAPPANHTTLGFVTYAESGDAGDGTNGIAQGTRMVTGLPQPLAANVCVKGMAGPTAISDCNLTVKTRTGKLALLGVIVDRDNRGTPLMMGDDVNTVTGYALVTGLAPTAGQTLGGITLTPIAAGDVATTGITLVTPPAPLSDSRAIAILELGDEGQFTLGFVPATPTMPNALLPKLTGPLSAAKYTVLGQASEGAGTARTSLVWLRSVNTAAAVSVGNWMGPPTQLTVNNGTLSFGFTGATGASIHAMRLVQPVAMGDDVVLWTMTFFDGTAAITLPALTPDPLPAAGTALSMRASSVDVPGFNTRDFSVKEAGDTLARLSEDRLPFSR